MNIFYVERNPIDAAQALCNSHVVKMTLESAQMLSTAHRVVDGSSIDPMRDKMLYKATHVNHPSSKWVRQSNNNYNWLFYHFTALLHEYTYRYGKHHKCEKLLPYLHSPPKKIPIDYLTPPPSAMDQQFIISEDSLENYRNYYIHGKKHLHQWKKREPPTWITK